MDWQLTWFSKHFTGKLSVVNKSRVQETVRIFLQVKRAKRIATNFDQEVESIRKRYLNDDYPRPFITSTIRSFQNKPSDDNDKLILDYSFKERRKIHIQVPCCTKSGKLSKKFIMKLSVKLILWQTKKIKSLFGTKNNNIHYLNVIYKRK